ncbi:response regulator transcription factor [Enterovibrio nigricans]|uniref:Two-component system, LuxR family, response regulator TtrR n=1 Tax=Enterovibrio nigricans DSM 22720 TaxID=1121868 RepID=A0A1T4UZK5_9GAMM|nr:response regulator [Enterovibrio nigricans]SKA58117.1 two-component system, LuxR family, response regulator TtrR [Enterovibrio nigricans DSM 22720]
MSNTNGLVYIVDDEDSVRESLVFMLESYSLNIKDFASATSFLEHVDTTQPGCIVLDSRMPEMRGQELQAVLNETRSPLSIIFLTGHGDVPMAVDALKDGAVDFFQKPVDGDQLVKAIEKALTYSFQRANHVGVENKFYSLTEREKSVLKEMLKGQTNQQMAKTLCVSLRTIEVHRANMMKKFEATNVADLVLRLSHLIQQNKL